MLWSVLFSPPTARTVPSASIVSGWYTSGVSAQVCWLVELPLTATYRPSASSVSDGYHRGVCMSATRVQVLLAGSKMLVSTMPMLPVVSPPQPPTTSTRPSGSDAAPSQKMLSGPLMVANVEGDAGSPVTVGCGCCQPSQASTLPV